MAARVSGVYMILNLVNGKFYIGSSVNMLNRWMNHRSSLRGNKHDNTYLQRSWNKYGEAQFRLKILDICHPSERFEREQHFIDTLLSSNPKKGYNAIAIVGEIFSNPTAREKLRQSVLDSYKDPERRARQAEHCRKLHADKELVKRRSEACKKTHAAGKVPGQREVCIKANAALHAKEELDPTAKLQRGETISQAKQGTTVSKSICSMGGKAMQKKISDMDPESRALWESTRSRHMKEAWVIRRAK